MAITVTRECIVPASGKPVAEVREQNYLSHTGAIRRESRKFQSQSDTADYEEYRDSTDNGKTWGEWVQESPAAKVKLMGEDEYEFGCYTNARDVWNPVHRHYITLRYQRLYPGGYPAATAEYWNGRGGFVDHGFLVITNEDRTETITQMVAFEDGITAFDEETYREEGYTNRNLGLGVCVYVMKNGDILFDHDISVEMACRLAGKDVYRVCPSSPRSAHAILICRGVWNAAENRYDLTFSEPLFLDDRQSSRGLDEPAIAELASGKILVVIRDSNLCSERWRTRISPYAPGYKLYALSDDGGKTFSPLMPWHFDTREVLYSSATYSVLVRSRKNGKLYWIGNHTEPTETYENYPRYPLQIVEVDEEWGCAIKETMTVIDTRRDDETKYVQLSNFSILENCETLDLELWLTKYGQHLPQKSVWDCEVWHYTITLE